MPKFSTTVKMKLIY